MSEISKRNEELAQLRWSCRRGMLELDMMLGRFLAGHYLALSPAEQDLFKEFLTCMDQDLFNWLLGSRQPSDPKFLPLIKKIQAYVPPGPSTKAF